jgi:hypothetical protein
MLCRQVKVNVQICGLCLLVAFLFDLLCSSEDGGEIFLRNIYELSSGYTALYPKSYNSSEPLKGWLKILWNSEYCKYKCIVTVIYIAYAAIPVLQTLQHFRVVYGKKFSETSLNLFQFIPAF